MPIFDGADTSSRHIAPLEPDGRHPSGLRQRHNRDRHQVQGVAEGVIMTARNRSRVRAAERLQFCLRNIRESRGFGFAASIAAVGFGCRPGGLSIPRWAGWRARSRRRLPKPYWRPPKPRTCQTGNRIRRPRPANRSGHPFCFSDALSRWRARSQGRRERSSGRLPRLTN